MLKHPWAFQVVLVLKNSPVNAGEVGLIPGLGRSFGGGHGNPLQHSCLENPMLRGAWGDYGPQGCEESHRTEMT